jgi:hypothetical protein
MANAKIERKENFRLTIEVRALPGGPMSPDPQGAPVESLDSTTPSSSFTMNAFDVLDRLEKKPADLVEMLRASILSTYANESRRRETERHFAKERQGKN